MQLREGMFDWNDLRVFITAGHAQSLSGAAARLNMDATTVGRRVARLEASLKATLFIRSSTGLQLTSAGKRLLDLADQIEIAVENLDQAQSEERVSGVVRLSVSEGFGTNLLAPALATLHAQWPGLNIELIANQGFLSPASREVDMVVTLTSPVGARLVIEPLADYELGLYCAPTSSQKYAALKEIADIQSRPVIGYVDDLVYAPELKYLDEIQPGLRPALASTSINAQREMIVSGAGIGILPCFMATGMHRLLPSAVKLKRRFWLATHRDVANSKRIRIVREWLLDTVHANRQLLTLS
jgi:DNA-binding transcriptional LysR family regulator